MRDFVKGLKIPRINIQPSIVEKLKIPLDAFNRNELARTRESAWPSAAEGNTRKEFNKNYRAHEDARRNAAVSARKEFNKSYRAHEDAEDAGDARGPRTTRQRKG